MQVKKIKLGFELFINEIFEITFVIFIFDQSLFIVLGAENLSCMKFIETHARTFLALIILPIGTVIVFTRVSQLVKMEGLWDPDW